MATTGSTGVLRLRYVPTITNKAAPTIAQVNAGTDLTPFLLRNGLSTPLEGSTVDAAVVDSLYNSTVAGSFGGQPVSLTLQRHTTLVADAAWSLLVPGLNGFLIVARWGLLGAGGAIAAAGDRVETWPITVITRAPADIADNELQRFMVSCAVPTPPSLDATVAA